MSTIGRVNRRAPVTLADGSLWAEDTYTRMLAEWDRRAERTRDATAMIARDRVTILGQSRTLADLAQEDDEA